MEHHSGNKCWNAKKKRGSTANIENRNAKFLKLSKCKNRNLNMKSALPSLESSTGTEMNFSINRNPHCNSWHYLSFFIPSLRIFKINYLNEYKVAEREYFEITTKYM